jgi:hypothetical protein
MTGGGSAIGGAGVAFFRDATFFTAGVPPKARLVAAALLGPTTVGF